LRRNTDYIFTIIDRTKGVGYSSSALSLLTGYFGYRKRSADYWSKLLKKDSCIEVKNLIICRTEIVKDTRGGLTSTSGLYGKPKNNNYE
jgi:hypothetical protein